MSWLDTTKGLCQDVDHAIFVTRLFEYGFSAASADLKKLLLLHR